MYSTVVIATVALCGIVWQSCDRHVSKLPQFDHQTVDGQHITNDFFYDKIVVVNVWSSWCHMCVSEITQLNELQQKYSKRGVEFIAISDMDANAVSAFLQRHPFTYPQIADKSLFDQFHKGVSKTIPKNIVVNNNGEVVFALSEGVHNIGSTLDQQIALILED